MREPRGLPEAGVVNVPQGPITTPRREMPRIIMPQVTTDRSTIDVSTASFDPDLVGIGSTPWNDNTSSRIFVPPDPTDNGFRYLARLCAEVVPAGITRRIRGVRQAVGIGFVLVNNDDDNPASYVVEIDQVSPFWKFSDGNISWHLRVIRGSVNGRGAQLDARAGVGVDYETGTDSVLIVKEDGLFGVEPPAAGIPAGLPLGCLGTFRDLRYPWRAPSGISSVDIEVCGPAIITFWASIRQTNPETRQSLNDLLPLTFDLSTLLPEDQFLVTSERNDLAPIYRHVSGSLIMETDQQYTRPGPDAIQAPSPV